MPSEARSGLDKLLALHPEAEVARVTHQDAAILAALRHSRAPYDEPVFTSNGPWTCVDLVENGKVLRFAIWNRTGQPYELDDDGAVKEDPIPQ